MGIVRRGGDSDGLKVLIVSSDDRHMHEKLEDNDYIGMTAVLLQDYALRHGYDCRKESKKSTGSILSIMRILNMAKLHSILV
jgi:hypothetical protein